MNTDLSKERITEVLEDLAKYNLIATARTRESLKALTMAGDIHALVMQGLNDAEYHARVMAEAARLLKEQK